MRSAITVLTFGLVLRYGQLSKRGRRSVEAAAPL